MWSAKDMLEISDEEIETSANLYFLFLKTIDENVLIEVVGLLICLRQSDCPNSLTWRDIVKSIAEALNLNAWAGVQVWTGRDKWFLVLKVNSEASLIDAVFEEDTAHRVVVMRYMMGILYFRHHNNAVLI